MDSGEILDYVTVGYKFIMTGRIFHFWLINKTHIAWLDPLNRPVNNPINIFLINSNIISYHVLFIKYLLISKILLVSIGSK